MADRDKRNRIAWRGSIRFIGKEPLEFKGAELQIHGPLPSVKVSTTAAVAATEDAPQIDKVGPFTTGVNSSATVSAQANPTSFPSKYRMFQHLDVFRVVNIAELPLSSFRGPCFEVTASEFVPAMSSLLRTLCRAPKPTYGLMAKTSYTSKSKITH